MIKVVKTTEKLKTYFSENLMVPLTIKFHFDSFLALETFKFPQNIQNRLELEAA